MRAPQGDEIVEHSLLEVAARAGPPGGPRIVGDHHDRLRELPVEAHQEVEDLVGAPRRPGRPSARRPRAAWGRRRSPARSPRAAPGRPRAAAAVAGAVGEPDDLRAVRARSRRSLLERAVSRSGRLDVLEGRQDRDQVVELEDETDVPAPPRRERGSPRASSGLVPATTTLPAARAVDARDQVQQRGLSRSRRAHQGQECPLRDLEVDAVEHGDRLAVPSVGLADVLEVDGQLAVHLLRRADGRDAKQRVGRTPADQAGEER